MKVKAADVAAEGPKYLGTPYATIDCQAFVEKCLKDAGLAVDLKGSNEWYREMTWTGSPEACKKKFGKIPKGAFLYIHLFDGGEVKRGYRDGLGNASHIGIYTGTGDGAIHSSASRGCVATSKFSGHTINGGWNVVGLWDRLSYDDTTDQMLNSEVDKTQVSEGQITNVEIIMDTMIVSSKNGSGVRMRKSASSIGTYMCTIPEGTIFNVTETKSGYAKVYYNGQEGWASLEYLVPTDTDSIKEPDPSATVTIPREDAAKLFELLGIALGEFHG